MKSAKETRKEGFDKVYTRKEIVDRFKTLDYSISKETARQNSIGRELIWFHCMIIYNKNKCFSIFVFQYLFRNFSSCIRNS